ncbi:MAG: transporter ATP-binding protein, partial [Rhodospirillales bacterium]|nr:transporter ATP-binding protein [Rhodospirillales bacterium]
AVPRFNMKDGERLQPLREITPATGHLLAPRASSAEETKDDAAPLLSVRAIVKEFEGRKGDVLRRAVDDVSLVVRRGETLGLVGESGCGKTTLCKIIMRALDPDEGSVVFDDAGTPVVLTDLQGRDLVPYRRRMQYVFQDPFSALNPRMTVFDIVSEPLVIHKVGDRAYRTEMVKELMELVGLDPHFLNRYPHSFSGGQRQRISIARALALKPDLLICDEPVSALDVSVQAQILNLLKDLQDTLGLTYIFVSHNLAVVDYISDRIAVMCRGRLVEVAPREVLFEDPVHPYTRALVSAVPFPDPDRKLDLRMLMEGRASDPEAWPAPFTVTRDAHLALMQVSAEHHVRMSEDQNMFRRAR